MTSPWTWPGWARTIDSWNWEGRPSDPVLPGHLADAGPVGIEIVVLVDPEAPARPRVDVPEMVVGADRRVAPVDHDPGGRVFDDPDVGIEAFRVLHVLEAAFLVVPGLDALVGHPEVVFRDPSRREARAAPEDDPDRRPVELDDHVRLVGHPEEVVPLPVIIQLRVIRPEPAGTGRPRGQNAGRDVRRGDRASGPRRAGPDASAGSAWS